MFGMGMDNMIKELLGVDPAELKGQIQTAVLQAQEKMGQFEYQQLFIIHQNTRIIKLLEMIARSQGLDPTVEETKPQLEHSVNVNGTGVN